MNRILAILLICCFSYQLTARLGVVAWYEANKEYITKVLCENRDKPQLNCCGKCYLKKQLDKTGDQPSQQTKVNKWDKADWVLFENRAVQYPVYKNITQNFTAYYIDAVGYEPLSSVFHPPPAITASFI